MAGGKTDSGEYMLYRKNGDTYPALVKTAPIFSENSVIGLRGLVIDITERKKIEEKLKINEKKYDTLMNATNTGYLIMDGKGLVLDANLEYVRLTGHKTLDQIKGRSVTEWTAKHDLERNAEEVRKCYQEGFVRNLEIDYVDENGKVTPIEINATVVESEQDSVIVTLCRDITERKKNEDTLRQSEEQFRQLFSNMPSGVVIYEAVDDGEDFVLRGFNAAAGKIEKVKKENVLGKRVTQVFEGVKSFGIFEVFQRVWRTGQPEYYPAALYEDNKDSGTWRENWIYKLPNGNITAIYNDISERVKTNIALRQERDMLESVAAASGAGLAIISKDYHVLWANDFIKRYKGDTIGKLCYASLNSLDAPCRDCGVAKIYAGKTTLDSHEYSSTTVDGNAYWVEIVATPLRDERGNVTSAVEICVDITERKKNEEKLRESIHKNELINEKLLVVGSLTRHDVGNKLMVVKSNLYLLRKQIGDNPKLAKYLEDINLAINQSDKMFEFSRFYEKIGVEERSKIDAAQCFNQAAMLLPRLDTIEIVNDCQGLEVMADSLLKQLFYNFLDNSLKYGEKVTQIRLHYTKEDDEVKLFYEDNGIGISETNKPKLFHEGFSTGKSTGLGLFLIKKLVEAYGWTIIEKGEPGKGAKFVITVPTSVFEN